MLPRPERAAPPGRDPSRSLEDDDLRRWSPAHRNGRADGHRQADQLELVPGLCRPGSGSLPGARRHRRHGQPRQPQDAGHPRGDRSGRSRVALPAALQPGLQPDRERLLQSEGAPAKGRSPQHRGAVVDDWRPTRCLLAPGVRQLLRQRRLRCNLIENRSRTGTERRPL